MLYFILILFFISVFLILRNIKKEQKKYYVNIKKDLTTLNEKIHKIDEEVKNIDHIINQIKTLDYYNKIDTKISAPEPTEVPPEKKIDVIRENITKPELTTKEVPLNSVTKKDAKLIENTLNIIKKIWNWIVIGEEFRDPKLSIEYSIATTWLLRIGITVFIICLGFFLKWSIDKGLLGYTGRVVLSVLAGLVMICIGIVNIGKKYHLIAQGLLGGGLSFLYFALYATGPMYNLAPYSIVFLLMCVVTVSSGILAYRINSQLVAILGIIGGYLTPILLPSSSPNLLILYSYLLLLSLAILGLSHFKQWHLFNYLGFTFTWGIFYGSLINRLPNKDFIIVITFLSLLFIFHSIIAYHYCIVQKNTSTILEIIHMLLNCFLFTVIGYDIIHSAYGRPWPAVMTISTAILYIVQLILFLRKKITDRALLITLLGIAGFFTSFSPPLITEKETLTICWSIMAFLFVWIANKIIKSNIILLMASILYLIVIGRISFYEIPMHYHNKFDWSNHPIREYLSVLTTRLWTFGSSVITMLGAYLIMNYKKAGSGKNNPLVIKDVELKYLNTNNFKTATFWFGITLLFTIIYLETFSFFSYYASWRQPVGTLLWVLFGVYILSLHFNKKKHLVYLIPVFLIYLIVLIKYLFFSYQKCLYYGRIHLIFHLFHYQRDIITRVIEFMFIFAFMIFLAVSIKNSDRIKKLYNILKWIVISFLFFYATIETRTFFYWHFDKFLTGSISILWGIFAISFIVIGIINSKEDWRYTGLGLFIVTLFKIFVFDMEKMDTIFRVFAFFALGIILLGGAIVYIKAGKKFIIKE